MSSNSDRTARAAGKFFSSHFFQKLPEWCCASLTLPTNLNDHCIDISTFDLESDGEMENPVLAFSEVPPDGFPNYYFADPTLCKFWFANEVGDERSDALPGLSFTNRIDNSSGQAEAAKSQDKEEAAPEGEEAAMLQAMKIILNLPQNDDNEESAQNNWDDSKINCFFSTSADGPPGKRSPEVWPKNCLIPAELTGDFRKKLSDMHVAPFEFRGHIFNSIEHVHHATKFIHEPTFYREFTIDGKYGANPVLAKQAGGKLGKVKKHSSLNQPVGIVKDKDWEKKRDG